MLCSGAMRTKRGNRVRSRLPADARRNAQPANQDRVDDCRPREPRGESVGLPEKVEQEGNSRQTSPNRAMRRFDITAIQALVQCGSPATLSASIFIQTGRNESLAVEFALQRKRGKIIVIGRNYFARQAATLLKLAKSTNDPRFAAALIEKAADLKSLVDESPAPDQSPQGPDVDRQL